ncbi:GDSL-type esterase/lipase family protein [Adhaeribacter radiodurans]|uniref:GDSL family lipase n=1 Tax=Adhaeribacter radiodurans TaxID=2745197 RepID=A0A7L7L5I2_9BACT|nr:GDSL-type esterase/lipase family protein [Adhaeribacter radiodurans]QMU28071.1 GDSL family lipase [Adhaeribacter radiodurans]
MRRLKLSSTLSCILFACLTLPSPTVLAQNKPQTNVEAPNSAFELKDGDRVVFIGNSLFENDLQYGYLELALTTRWLNRNVTYRNIGWTGDTVWGEARSYITNPPTPYDLMMDQLTKAQPTVVFIAYGGIEAQEGEAGLSHFQEGLNKLLDKIEQLGAKAILLSPIPVLSALAPEELASRNAMLEKYGSAIAKTAAERNKRYIDVFKPLLARNKEVALSDNGIHLNESGYYYLAAEVENGLGLTSRQESITIDAAKHTATATSAAKILDSGNKEALKFTVEERILPLPLPHQSEKVAEEARVVKITGLKKGIYTLTADDSQVITASANKWKEGVVIRQGASFSQAEELREKIIKKNDLFFQQYRPLNKTYILGFRSYEQGRHVKTLDDLSYIITWLEGQIALNRAPKSKVYQLTLVK